MKTKIVIIGTGGHAKSCAEAAFSSENYNLIGFVGNQSSNTSILGLPIIGDDNDIDKIRAHSINIHLGIGQIKNNETRTRLYEYYKNKAFKIINLQAKTAVISSHCEMGDSNTFLHYVTINNSCTIGSNNIFNTKSTVEHDVKIGNNNHISTGAILNGNVEIGHSNFIGSGSIIKEGVRIGNQVIIGAGTVVLNDILNPGIYFGNPAKKHE